MARANQLGRYRWASITSENNNNSQCYYIIIIIFVVVGVVVDVVAVVTTKSSSILKCIYILILYTFKLQRFTANRGDVHIALFRLH